MPSRYNIVDSADYLPSLLDEAIQYYSCFISSSSKDEAFAKLNLNTYGTY